MEALLATRPTSPVKDVLFIKLTQILDLCQKSKGCSACQVRKRCNEWFNRVCEISSQHTLSQGEFQKALSKFNEIQPGLF